MQITVDGRTVRWQDLDVREIGFGQAVNPSYPYEIILGPEEAAAMFRAPYKELVADLRGSRRRPGEWPEIDRLAALGYPGIPDLFANHPRLLEYLVARSLRPHWLYTTFEPDAAFRFVVNSIAAVRVGPQEMTITGEVYPRP